MKRTERKISIIAGPCSAESPEQLRTVAEELVKDNVKYMRAGIWKPRTRPDTFEGVGEKGLKWLSDIQDSFPINVMTEVASASHVEKAIDHGINTVWIGARTTVNPFYVQEIADALQGTDVEVFVKNPINADASLWLGAIERVEKSTNKVPHAIHRGFSFHGKSHFRNVPIWQIPIEVMTQRPEIKMICDVSHIAGRREYIQEIAQKAIDLNYTGLMVEVHPDPEYALSDAQQQITPKRMHDLLNALVIRSVEPPSKLPDDLVNMRDQIDQIDDEILDLMSKRMNICEDIGKFKKRQKISILQPDRWSKVVSQALSCSEKLSLSDNFIQSIFKAIHDESIEHQTRVMNKKLYKERN